MHTKAHREINPRLAETSIYIDDTPNMRISEVRSKAKRLHLKHSVDMIVVDYIQLLRGDEDLRVVREIALVGRLGRRHVGEVRSGAFSTGEYRDAEGGQE